MVEVIDGPAAQWLTAHRGPLNARMMAALKRYPALSVPNFFAELAEILPPLAASATLLDTAYDLILLHLGRNAFTRTPALRRVLTTLVPKRLGLFSAHPELVAQVSNATENALDAARFVDALLALPELDAPALLRAGAVIAWRLGDARIRTAALPLLDQIPPRALLVAFAHSDWPDTSAAMLVAQLRADQWRVCFTAPPVKATAPHLDLTALTELSRFGDFTGFGGLFDSPPTLLQSNDAHTFFVRCGDKGFAIVADGFGAQVRPLTSELPASAVLLSPGLGQQSPKLRGLVWQTQDHVVVAVSADSHRISVLG